MDDKVRDQLRELLNIANAVRTSMQASLSADPENIWKYGGYKQFARKYNQLVTAVAKLIPIDNALIDFYDEEKIPGLGDSFAPQQKALFESVHMNLAVLASYLEGKLNLIQDERKNLADFLQANLRKALHDTPEKESDVQNAVENLLIGRGLEKGIDYDRETGRVKVSIKEVIPDFVLPKLGRFALEVKLSRDKTKSKVIVGEINADIQAYGKKYDSILFVVYDLGSIRDEVEFKQDLENTENVRVIVVKH